MCTVLLPPGVSPIAVDKYIYHIKCRHTVKAGTEVLLFASKKTGVEMCDRSCNDVPSLVDILTNRLEMLRIQIRGKGIKMSAFACSKHLRAR